MDIVDGEGAPRLLGGGDARVPGLGQVDHGGPRRGHDDAADARGGARDGLEDAGGADYGRVDEVLLGVGDVEVEGGGRVEDGLEAGGLDDLVEGVRLGNVRHDDRLQAVLAQAGMGVVDLLRLVLGADGRHHLVVSCEQLLEDVSGNEAGTTCGVIFSKTRSLWGWLFGIFTSEQDFGHFV